LLLGQLEVVLERLALFGELGESAVVVSVLFRE
jgi:hypothetical protein